MLTDSLTQILRGTQTHASSTLIWLAGRSMMLIALYYAVALWGVMFTPDAVGIPLVWPATGVGLAFVYTYGYRLLPALAVALTLVAWQLTGGMMPWLATLGTMAATLVGVALGVHLLRRLEFAPRLERLRDVGWLLAVGGGVSSGAAATAGAWGITVGMDAVAFSDAWWVCWSADIMGMLLITPVLLLVLQMRQPWSCLQDALGVALLLGGVFISAIVYLGGLPLDAALSLSYAIFPVVILTALRGSALLTTGLMALAGGIALSGTGWGLGPFAGVGLEHSLLALNAQLALLVLTGLVVLALRGEREAAQERARQHLDALARAGRLSTLGELSAGLAHELNQPLCALASYAQTSQRLLQQQRWSELAEVITQLDRGAHRAAETVRQMRAFAAQQTQDTHCLALQEVIEPVLDLLQPMLRRQRVTLNLQLARHLPPVRIVPLHIEQVLINVLQNALDALRGQAIPGQIHLLAQVEKQRLVVRVHDNGPGIPPQRLASLFQPFATWKEGGVGLGLSISRSLIEAQGGQLQARNHPEGGAEFWFSLPVVNDCREVPYAAAH